MTHRSALVLALTAILALAPAAAQVRPSRVLVWEAVLRGESAGELRWPVAVAAASDAEIAVADAWGPRLVIFNRTGDLWTAARVVTLPAPPLAVAWDGRRYAISLRRGGGLMVLEGPAPKRLPLPSGVVPGAIAGGPGGLVVFDLARREVLTLDPGGEVTARAPVGDHLSALTVAPDGGIYAVFAAAGEVRRFAPDGRELGRWKVPGDGPVPAWPVAVEVEADGDLVVLDRHGGRIVVLDAGGRLVGVGSRRGWESGLLRFPAAMTRLPDGALVVADQGNGRVQVFRPLDAISDPPSSPPYDKGGRPRPSQGAEP